MIMDSTTTYACELRGAHKKHAYLMKEPNLGELSTSMCLIFIYINNINEPVCKGKTSSHDEVFHHYE